MTITSSVSRVDYVGNGSTTAFAVPFPFFDTDEIRVLSRVIATGVETVLTLTTHYTVTGGGGSTGTVTAVTAPASMVQWSILRATRRTQDVDYQANDPFPAETHERALDRVVAVVQEIERDAQRSLRVAETDSTSSLTLPTQGERASRILGFDVDGNPVPVLPEAGTLAVTPYAEDIVSSGSAATARGVLGSGAIGDALFTASTAAAARDTLGVAPIPVGMIMPYAGATAPSRWVLSYGQALSRTTYAALFAAIGTAWGVGDGSTTFNVPDLRGRSLFGKDDMGGTAASRVTSGVSGVAGATLGGVGGDQRLQSHTHEFALQGSPGVGSGANGWFVGVGPLSGQSTTSTGGGSSQNMPPAAIVNWMIYAGV